MRPITAVVVASAAALIVGCEGSGSPTSADSTLGCQSLQASQNLNNWSNCLSFTGGGGGGGGGGANSAGAAPAALYRLVKVNGNPLPFTVDSDSVTVVGDSSRVIHIVLDSSIISLNTDSTVTQIDYFNIRDFRQSHNNVPPNRPINWSAISFPDTSNGIWSDSTGQPIIELLVGRVNNIGYLYSGDTLTANYPFTYTDTSNTTVAVLASFTYQNVGSPDHQIVTNRPHVSRASSSTSSPIRQSRTGGTGLRFMRSDDGSGRLVRIIRQ